MPRKISGSSVSLVLAGLILISGCYTKAEPAGQAGFADSRAMMRASDLPFQRVWRKKGVDFPSYRKIYIAPVNTGHLLEMTWIEKTGHGSKVMEDIEQFAATTYQSLRKEFRDNTHHPFLVLSSPRRPGLILELAIVELVPTKAALKAAGLIPGIALPVNLAGLAMRGTVAFEARVRDAETGEIIALFADREAAKISIVNIKNYTWYSHANGIVKEWAQQLVQTLTKEQDEIIDETPWFELKPW